MFKLFALPPLITALSLPLQAATLAENDQLAENQTLNVWMQEPPAALDPQNMTNIDAGHILRQLFEGLMNEDASGRVVPGAAERYEVSTDGLTYTFHLREALWSNGDPVTAGDFVTGWRRAVDPANKSPDARLLADAHVVNARPVIRGELPPDQLGVRALDDKTLEVRLTEPAPWFVTILSHPVTFPVNNKQKAGQAIIGNGAYKLTSPLADGDLALTKRDDYWNAENTVISAVNFVSVNDQMRALEQYQTGVLDWVSRLPGPLYQRLKREYPDQAITMPNACTYAYIFNLSDKGHEALQDANIRRALSLALDRSVIARTVLQGEQRPAETWTHRAITDLEAPEADTPAMTQADKFEQATELMRAVGYSPDNPLNLVLQYNAGEEHKQIARAVRAAWGPLGVNLGLRSTDWAQHAERLANQDFQIARYGWCADYNHPTAFLDWFSKDGPNSGVWQNTEFGRILNEAATSDGSAEKYRQAEDILSAELPLIPIYHYADQMLIKKDLRGIPMANAMGRWYAKDIYRAAP